MIPKGFTFSTIEAAIKKPGRRDLALIHSEAPATMAGVFTTNRVQAAPVKQCMSKVRSGKGQTIVVNSGNANACTGLRGMKDAEKITKTVAQLLGTKHEWVYPCSTGVIGMPLPMERIAPALPSLAEGLGKASLDDVAKAIMTTDTFPKMVRKKVRVGKTTGTIAGICKGAGMIAPNMATMLCFLITDLAVDAKALQSVVKGAANLSFNRITIDGDMSTNDTVLMMANGMAGNALIKRNSPDFEQFRKAVETLMYELARLVVQDGEGATKLIEVVVKGAKTEADAERAAFSIANSNLVKTAVYGNDANWGRIICALGYSKISFEESRTDIFFNKVKVVKGGLANNKDKEAGEVLKNKEITISVDLHAGTASAKVLTCDFSEEYVKINAEYRT